MMLILSIVSLCSVVHVVLCLFLFCYNCSLQIDTTHI